MIAAVSVARYVYAFRNYLSEFLQQCGTPRRAWSHCDKSPKNLRRCLVGYLPPVGKFGLKSGLRKSMPKGRFSAEDYNLQVILSPALRHCFFEVYVFVLFFDEVDG